MNIYMGKYTGKGYDVRIKARVPDKNDIIWQVRP